MSRPAWSLRRWLPALLWAGFIFWGSTDALSVPHTSRFLRPLLHWLAPDLGEDTLAAIQLCLRKTGHMVEYAILAGLLWRPLNSSALGHARAWPSRLAWWAWGLAVAYAASDELHQTFVASREGTGRDVGIDAFGAALALGAIWLHGRRRGHWVESPALPANLAP